LILESPFQDLRFSIAPKKKPPQFSGTERPSTILLSLEILLLPSADDSCSFSCERVVLLLLDGLLYFRVGGFFDLSYGKGEKGDLPHFTYYCSVLFLISFCPLPVPRSGGLTPTLVPAAFQSLRCRSDSFFHGSCSSPLPTLASVASFSLPTRRLERHALILPYNPRTRVLLRSPLSADELGNAAVLFTAY